MRENSFRIRGTHNGVGKKKEQKKGSHRLGVEEKGARKRGGPSPSTSLHGTVLGILERREIVSLGETYKSYPHRNQLNPGPEGVQAVSGRVSSLSSESKQN